jgi:PIN domain nuclease of toxin-antitoxin system
VRLLLDTHTLLWFYLGDAQLSPAAQAAIVDPINTKSVSPASFWEIAIKVSLRKYVLNESYEDFIQHAIFDNGFDILAIEPKHTAALITLPYHHKDPFDRLLIVQAIVEGIRLVSADAIIDAYGVPRIW